MRLRLIACVCCLRGLLPDVSHEALVPVRYGASSSVAARRDISCHSAEPAVNDGHAVVDSGWSPEGKNAFEQMGAPTAATLTKPTSQADSSQRRLCATCLRTPTFRVVGQISLCAPVRTALLLAVVPDKLGEGAMLRMRSAWASQSGCRRNHCMSFQSLRKVASVHQALPAV